MQQPPGKGLGRLRADAISILDACLAAADSEEAVKRHITIDNGNLFVNDDLLIRRGDWDRIIVVGAGKASAPMAKALEEILGDEIDGGLICVKYGHGMDLKKIRVLEAGHPVPDSAGENAAVRIAALLEAAGPRDVVISCISGGGSALLPAPADGISLKDKQDLTAKLLAAGADIQEINTLRKHVSLTKGGNLARLAYPAFVVNLMLSDVIGDDPGTIASGPFAPDSSTFPDALSILERYDLTESVPKPIIDRIRSGVEGSIQDTAKEGDIIFTKVRNAIVGSNILSLLAGQKKAKALGYDTVILSSSVQGDTREAAGFHYSVASEVRATGNPAQSPACLLSGGETTVKIKGSGLGGRNQEFALSLVKRAAKLPGALFLSAGTDGTDGPTDAAGALVDTDSLSRASLAHLDPDTFLENNDSYHFFQKLGDLIVTGPTRTNVMDVRIVLVASRVAPGPERGQSYDR